ncbi:MAG: hypothetical protein U9R04_05600 [Chloroflexota bacterium]|nr:hypothetical protein [Chloroflexota bacterium]
MADKKSVRDFLQKVKETIANPPANYQAWVLVSRGENKECIARLGFKYQDIRDSILALSVSDYCEGPCQDYDQRGELWVFGKIIEGREIYIKLKLASFGSLSMVRIVSFHFAKESLGYPFQERTSQEVQEK